MICQRLGFGLAKNGWLCTVFFHPILRPSWLLHPSPRITQAPCINCNTADGWYGLFGVVSFVICQVRHVLTHTTGLQHAFPAKATFDKFCDWEATQKMLEAAKPAWPPGTRASYHYFTFGWLVAALVEKASGVPFGQVT